VNVSRGEGVGQPMLALDSLDQEAVKHGDPATNRQKASAAQATDDTGATH
jgi:hypothetical protein